MNQPGTDRRKARNPLAADLKSIVRPLLSHSVVLGGI